MTFQRFKWKKDGTTSAFFNVNLRTPAAMMSLCHYVLLTEGWLTTWKAFGQVALNEANPWSSSSLVLVVPGIQSFFWTSLPAWSEGRLKLLYVGSWTLQNGAKFRFGITRLDRNIFNVFSLAKNFKHVHTFLDIDIVLEILTLWTIRSNLVHCDAPARVHAGERSNLHPCPLHTMAFGLSTVLNCMLKAGTCPIRVAEVTLYSTVQPLALLKWFERLQRDASQKRSQKYLSCI